MLPSPSRTRTEAWSATGRLSRYLLACQNRVRGREVQTYPALAPFSQPTRPTVCRQTRPRLYLDPALRTLAGLICRTSSNQSFFGEAAAGCGCTCSWPCVASPAIYIDLSDASKKAHHTPIDSKAEGPASKKLIIHTPDDEHDQPECHGPYVRHLVGVLPCNWSVCSSLTAVLDIDNHAALDVNIHAAISDAGSRAALLSVYSSLAAILEIDSHAVLGVGSHAPY
ncbi:uncharacterized protein K452DRAFT_99282 [Aplosporella prunicola CBS 121167]|uniref:Uncharacterized protein n=1 Tax=Aplosporella prunicola CBS 121167 TaxID=1176127 RepID=A0A6A6B4A1_9PEZI|nr:uncharacterized protein K452DRAFT_99282 [Aplosporella prunicola CBS 121167]KAF2137581.1 hypothetical protein K452DRAFT_99282 [Aplosporella prunicola CBS 121167]